MRNSVYQTNILQHKKSELKKNTYDNEGDINFIKTNHEKYSSEKYYYKEYDNIFDDIL